MLMIPFYIFNCLVNAIIMKNAEYVISKSSLEMYANFFWHKHVPMQINKDLIFMKFI